MSKAKILKMPMAPRKVLEIIRSTAEDSSRVVNTLVFRDNQKWRQRVTSRQIDLCLREGEIAGEPKKNEHGHWVCTLTRLCAGLDIYITVALECEDKDQSKWRLFIIDVENEQ